MSHEKKVRPFKTGGPSLCWECGRQLVRVKDGFLFSQVEDVLGNKSRVHKDCVKRAVGGGVREFKEEKKE